MFVSLFGLKVEDVSINELSVTLRLKDSEGNTITAFFDSVDEVRDFSKKVRRAVMDEADKNWVRFERQKPVVPQSLEKSIRQMELEEV